MPLATRLNSMSVTPNFSAISLPVEHHHLDVSAHQPAHSSNPKTFQLRTIAALPEPAGRPTHGLLSRRSTDRISTSPLANFAQLSMFRFDGLKIQIKL
ncbi:TPA: hypothetical protein O8L39_004359 [Enterobacter kobei]|nr:hypothetical protein [Enterobacter kobei]